MTFHNENYQIHSPISTALQTLRNIQYNNHHYGRSFICSAVYLLKIPTCLGVLPTRVINCSRIFHVQDFHLFGNFIGSKVHLLGCSPAWVFACLGVLPAQEFYLLESFTCMGVLPARAFYLLELYLLRVFICSDALPAQVFYLLEFYLLEFYLLSMFYLLGCFTCLGVLPAWEWQWL